MRGARILIVGLGDLGRRLALTLATASADDDTSELVLCGRAATATSWARLTAAASGARVRGEAIDLLDTAALTALLTHEQPTLIVQCASLLPPFMVTELAERAHPLALALRAGGFGLQLAAQLPLVRSLMQARRLAKLMAPVVNCSYPDVTHPVLAAQDLAPTLGVGNAGMVAALVRATLRAHSPTVPPPLVRVLAHHAHVTPVVLADRARLGRGPAPQVMLGDAGERRDELAFAGAPLPATRELNALTAAHATAVVRALLPAGAPLRTSAPGPFGWAGGWPVRIAHGELTLDLPAGVDLQAARSEAAAAAIGDGIVAIDAGGVVHYSDAARAALAAVAPELAAPLEPNDALSRARRLRQLLELQP
jgi:hypothetical protein